MDHVYAILDSFRHRCSAKPVRQAAKSVTTRLSVHNVPRTTSSINSTAVSMDHIGTAQAARNAYPTAQTVRAISAQSAQRHSIWLLGTVSAIPLPF